MDKNSTLIDQLLNLKQENLSRAEQANLEIDELIKDLEFITQHIGDVPMDMPADVEAQLKAKADG